MSILGLIGTEDLSAHRYKSARRKVFYDYPNGSAPLTGLLSLQDEEECNDPEFDWNEKRMKQQKTTTDDTTPFNGDAATTSTWGNVTRTGGKGVGAGAAYTASDIQAQEKLSLHVTDTTQFRIGHIIKVEPVALTGGTSGRLLLRVAGYNATGPTTTTTVNPLAAGNLDCYVVGPVQVGTATLVSTQAAGLEVLVVGSAFEQGQAGSSFSSWTAPINPQNFCQIFRTKFGATGSNIKTALKWDRSGIYQDRAKEASIDHMIELEKAFLFGERSMALNPNTNQPVYTTGGALWFLYQWELAGANAVIKYRGATASAVTADTDDNKRIIENTTGFMTEKLYDGYVERAFRKTSNKANEKLVLCGNKFLNVINQLYKSKSVLDGGLPLSDTYGMDVVKHRSPFGTLYYKTHPLFNQNTLLQNNALFLDVGWLKYRYLIGRDTDLLENRQANDEDARVDEWLGECGLEFGYPEAHMYMKNVLDYAP